MARNSKSNIDDGGKMAMENNLQALQLSSRALLESMKSKFQTTMEAETVVTNENTTKTDESSEKEGSSKTKTTTTKTSSKHTKRMTLRATTNKEEEDVPLLPPETETQLRAHQEKIIWRDFTFLMVAMVLGSIMGWVELNSGSVSARGGTLAEVSQTGIVDTGFILTKSLHAYLEEHRWVNDVAAGVNTIIGVVGPMLYMVYQTVWVGDYDVVFRYLAISTVRSLCGWVTYLPPDSSYLVSYYDFPDIAQCLLKDCGDPRHAQVQPFVSFFSGHVATLVINANHMYVNGFQSLAIFFHIFNVFQIIRLLASRGHYSIDIVIGWYMAVYVSNVAGRLGRHFSRGDKGFEELYFPVSSRQAFERITGISHIKTDRRVSQLLRDPGIKESYDSLQEEEETLLLVEPTARMVAEGKIDSRMVFETTSRDVHITNNNKKTK